LNVPKGLKISQDMHPWFEPDVFIHLGPVSEREYKVMRILHALLQTRPP